MGSIDINKDELPSWFMVLATLNQIGGGGKTTLALTLAGLIGAL